MYIYIYIYIYLSIITLRAQASVQAFAIPSRRSFRFSAPEPLQDAGRRMKLLLPRSLPGPWLLAVFWPSQRSWKLFLLPRALLQRSLTLFLRCQLLLDGISTCPATSGLCFWNNSPSIVLKPLNAPATLLLLQLLPQAAHNAPGGTEHSFALFLLPQDSEEAPPKLLGAAAAASRATEDSWRHRTLLQRSWTLQL